jgi:translin
MVNRLLRKADINLIQKDLAELDTARDSVFQASRISTRFSGRAIVELHRGDIKKADEQLADAEKALRDLEELVRKREGLKYIGNVAVAYQEYAEAKLLYIVMTKEKILSLKEVGVGVEPYLLGLLDLIGELRRLCLNFLRVGQVSKAEYSMKTMEEIYEDLYSIDHTAIIPNFRHKMDIARRIIESTRGDVVSAVRRLSLENTLKDFEQRLLKKTSAWCN